MSLAVEGYMVKARKMARSGNVHGATASFRKAKELQPGLNIEPEKEATELAATELVREGQRLAETRELESAVASFRKAVELKPDLGIDPEQEAKARAGQGFYLQGWQLAKAGDFEGAVTSFRKAVELKPELGIDPKKKATDLVTEVLVEKGKMEASEGNINGAVAYFREASKLDSALDLEPEKEAAKYEIRGYLERSRQLVRRGELEKALKDIALGVEAYTRAKERFQTFELQGSDCNSLCWYGSLAGKASEVMEACQRAVETHEEHGGYRDSRGVARALVGEKEGAIEDFRYYIQWGKTTGKRPQSRIQQRVQWIRQLKAGGNPFDQQTVRSLLSQ
jgi:tetratricopeptide (TPR) repeat protein